MSTTQTDLIGFAARAGGSMFTTTCTSKERKAFLLATRGRVFGNGELWQVKFKALGAGVYEVSCRERAKL